MESNQAGGPHGGETGPLLFKKKSGGEGIALLIMGMGLLTTGFFTGWIYFQIREGIGPGKSKDKPVPMAITPIASNDDPLSILGSENLSWKVAATKGKFGLLLQFKGTPTQGITFEIKEGASPALLLLVRQKVVANEETWTLALGKQDSPSHQERQTVKVFPRGAEKPIARVGPVPLSATEPVELAVMKWTPTANDPADAPVQATILWYPPAALAPAEAKKSK